MIDVQEGYPDISLRLTKVGVTRVKRLLKVPRRGKRPIILLTNFEVFVDLPSSQKGAHMSRNHEAINEVLDEMLKEPVYVLEGLCVDIANEVLNRHEYAMNCEVRLDSKLMISRKAASDGKRQGFVKLVAGARANREDGMKIEKKVGAEVRGVISCPRLRKSLVQDAEKDMPIIGGHTQRATSLLTIEVPESYEVRIEDIIEILENAMSAKTNEFLSGEEELKVILEAYSKPRFVDDICRKIVKEVVEKFDFLPDEARITVRCLSEEVLYSYNTFAERISTLGELRDGN